MFKNKAIAFCLTDVDARPQKKSPCEKVRKKAIISYIFRRKKSQAKTKKSTHSCGSETINKDTQNENKTLNNLRES